MSKIAIIYHSVYGHTKLQAQAVFRGAQSVAPITAQLYTAEEAAARLDELDAADAIIFGCATYMGSMSAGMKSFIEAAAKKWFTLAWKNKVAGAFTNSSSFSGDKLNTLVGLVINAMQHGMIFVGLGMMPSANKPEDMNKSQGRGQTLTIALVRSWDRCPLVSKSTHRTHRAKATLRRRRCTADELQKLHFNLFVEKTPNHALQRTARSHEK